MIKLVTGGARSGKSTYAEKMTRKKSGKTSYIATAVPFDEGMKDRIRHHQMSRPAEWKTIEQYKDYKTLSENEAFTEADNILYDCVTVMITNQMIDSGLDFDLCSMEEVHALEAKISEDVDDLLNLLSEKDTVIVTNELGSGLVPSYRMGNLFRDIAGRINQKIAYYADEVWLCVSGIPIQIK